MLCGYGISWADLREVVTPSMIHLRARWLRRTGLRLLYLSGEVDQLERGNIYAEERGCQALHAFLCRKYHACTGLKKNQAIQDKSGESYATYTARMQVTIDENAGEKLRNAHEYGETIFKKGLG